MRALEPPEWEKYQLRTAELCAGYGGMSLAIGDKHPTWVSEIDPHASRVLRDRFPYSPNLGDMTLIDWAAAPELDVLMGGTPCQDLSAAGRRAGMAPETRSGLWSHMYQAAEELRPNVVIWENVAGARTARGGRGIPALGRVVTDLAALGYGVVWDSVRASDAGAPHRRERVFVLAFRPAASDALRVLLDRTREARLRGPEPSDQDSPSHDPRLGGYGERLRLWESLTGVPMPEPEEDSPRGGRRLSARFGEWMMGLPRGWVTGIRTIPRSAQVRILGNGVVPQQGRLAVHTLAQRGLEVLQ
nr:MAG TPA: Cytosine specific methyltransferase [Caudoviricetes sp.]